MNNPSQVEYRIHCATSTLNMEMKKMRMASKAARVRGRGMMDGRSNESGHGCVNGYCPEGIGSQDAKSEKERKAQRMQHGVFLGF